jgi:hypothetical protein
MQKYCIGFLLFGIFRLILSCFYGYKNRRKQLFNTLLRFYVCKILDKSKF